MTVATAVPALTRITPPTPAPIRAEPSTTASTMPAPAIARRRPAAAHGGVQRGRDRGEHEHREARLELVADAVEARAEDRVGAEQRAHQQLRAGERVDGQREDGDERRGEQRARPGQQPVGQRAERQARERRSSRTRPARSARAPPASARRRAPTARASAPDCASPSAPGRAAPGQPRASEQQRPAQQPASQRRQPPGTDHAQPGHQGAQARAERRGPSVRIGSPRMSAGIGVRPRCARIVGAMSTAAIRPRWLVVWEVSSALAGPDAGGPRPRLLRCPGRLARSVRGGGPQQFVTGRGAGALHDEQQLSRARAAVSARRSRSRLRPAGRSATTSGVRGAAP